MTNFEYIKGMSVEDLAKWLVWFTEKQFESVAVDLSFNENEFKKALAEWLESEGEAQ